jgi:hypothetical protein
MKRSRSTATQDATLPLFPDYAELEELPVYDEPLLSPEWAEGGYFVASVKRYRVGDDYVAFSLMRHRRGFARASCCGILMYDLMLDMWATRSLRNRDLANRVRREQPNLDAFLSEAGLQLYLTIALKAILPQSLRNMPVPDILRRYDAFLMLKQLRDGRPRYEWEAMTLATITAEVLGLAIAA